MPQPETLLCVPCYNESKRLDTAAFTAFARANPNVGLLFVNDGSTDDTLATLERMATDSDNMFVLNLDKNSGKAEAVRRGMLYACENFQPTYAGFWDADLATPLDELPSFVKIISRNSLDAVTGLRLMRLGAKVKRRLLRHLVGRFFATAAAAILHVNVYDTQCGAKLYNARIVPQLFAERFITRWFFDVEILARYIKTYGVEPANRNFYEFPVSTWEDVSGSRLKFRDFITVPVELWKIKRHYF